MFKTNQPKESMFTRDAMIKGIAKATAKDKAKKNQPKETMNKKEIKKVKEQFKKDHKYIGYHNTKEVCSATHWNPISAKFLCEEKLLNYFHNLQDNVTKYSLDQYLGQVSYAGYKEIDA